MAQGGIPRMTQPTGSTNAGAGPTPIGATVPSPASGGGQWSPTVVNLLILLVVEVCAFAALRMLFKKV